MKADAPKPPKPPLEAFSSLHQLPFLLSLRRGRLGRLLVVLAIRNRGRGTGDIIDEAATDSAGSASSANRTDTRVTPTTPLFKVRGGLKGGVAVVDEDLLAASEVKRKRSEAKRDVW